MRKKKYLYLSLISFIIISLSIYLSDLKSSKKEDFKNIKINKKNKFIKIKSVTNKPLSKNVILQKTSIIKKKENKWSQDVKRLTSYYNKTLEKWTMIVKQLIINEFYYDIIVYNKYLAIRTSYEDEKLDSYGRYYENTKENYDENYQIDTSKVESEIDKKLKEKYQNKIKELFKSDNYERYIEVLKDFNEKQRLNTHDELPLIMLDL